MGVAGTVSSSAASDSRSELSPRIAAWIEDFHDRLEEMDLFEVLGVDLETDALQLRRAYLLRSFQFHPDRYYGKSLGLHKAMLARIFARVSATYRLLKDDERRETYRRQLMERQPPPSAQQARVQSGVIGADEKAGLEFELGD